jgi:anaerobic C4-dicarboxylate transporter
MDEQHDGLCFPISVAGILFLSILVPTFIHCLQFFGLYIPTPLLCVQFICEYTSKVDGLVKDKIESQKEEQAKEKEEKNLVAQQVIYSAHTCDQLFMCKQLA